MITKTYDLITRDGQRVEATVQIDDEKRLADLVVHLAMRARQSPSARASVAQGVISVVVRHVEASR